MTDEVTDTNKERETHTGKERERETDRKRERERAQVHLPNMFVPRKHVHACVYVNVYEYISGYVKLQTDLRYFKHEILLRNCASV